MYHPNKYIGIIICTCISFWSVERCVMRYFDIEEKKVDAKAEEIKAFNNLIDPLLKPKIETPSSEITDFLT